MAGGFARLKLSNEEEALGLPKGSVRALIALFLILIWLVISVYLFNAVGSLDPKQDPGMADSIRLAEQLYTTMSTLVVAIAAFYFGSSSVAAASAAIARTLSKPNPTSVDPQSVELPTGNLGQTVALIIKGSNFQMPSSVRLSRKTPTTTDEIIADPSSILSSPTQINCTIIITSDKTTGEWDLFLVNNDGGDGHLQNAFKIDPPK